MDPKDCQSKEICDLKMTAIEKDQLEHSGRIFSLEQTVLTFLKWGISILIIVVGTGAWWIFTEILVKKGAGQ